MNEVTEEQLLIQPSTGEAAPASLDDGTVGGRLTNAREQRGWSIQYVADQLKLSQTQILALESNQFEKLPKLVIVRGFVRTYSKLLRVDGDELVALLPQDSEPVKLEASLRPALSTPFVDSRASLSGHQDNNGRYILGLIVLVVLVAIILFIQRTDSGQQLQAWAFGTSHQSASSVPSIETPAASIPTVTSVSAFDADGRSASVAADSASASVVSQSSGLSVAPAEAESLLANAGASSVKLESKSDAKFDATVVAGATGTSGRDSSDALVLTFKQDSWIYVKTSSGQVLSSHMARAGSEEVFNAKQGLFLKIGNAAGVEAKLRGQALSIVADRDSKVANVSVK